MHVICPERLFFYNLMSMTGLTSVEFCKEVDHHTIDETRSDLKSLEELVSNGYFLPEGIRKIGKDLSRYVQDIGRDDRNAKMRDYFLYTVYSTITHELHKMEVKDGFKQLKRQKNILERENFRKIKEDFGALCDDDRLTVISCKNLRRLEDLRCVKRYTRNQLSVISYIIQFIFPLLEINGIPFMKVIVSHSWDRIVLYYNDEKKVDFVGQQSSTDCLREKFQDMWNKICLHAINEEYYNCGELIVELLQKVSSLHYEKVLMPIVDFPTDVNCAVGFSPKTYTSLESENLELEDVNDVLLSSHIVSFATWIPIMTKAEIDDKTMQAVSGVIDTIRDPVKQELLGVSPSDLSSHSSWNDSNEGGFFVRINEALRKKLINAMTAESYFCNQFRKNYCQSSSKYYGD